MVKQVSRQQRIRAMTLRTGAMPLAGYTLGDRRGRGGFGEVWEAQDRDGRYVALKFLPCRQSTHAVQEIRALQSLQSLEHPNLLRCERIWCLAGYIVVAMELAEGSVEDLFELHQKELGTPLSPEHACHLLFQAAQALDYLNGLKMRSNGRVQGFQHCDIKPSNLLLFGDTVKVSDFGLARQVATCTETRCSGGTLDYCAPEMFRGQISPHTDQFALAVSYCRIRGGCFPFRDTPSSMKELCTRQSPDLSMLASPEQTVVARALDPLPARRWSSCGEFLGQLTRVVVAEQ